MRWVRDCCSSEQLLLRRNISLKVRSKKLSLLKKVSLKRMELARLWPVGNMACTFWKGWLPCSWITFLSILSLIISLCEELPSVAVFESGEGWFGLDIKVDCVFLQWVNELPLRSCLHIAFESLTAEERRGEKFYWRPLTNNVYCSILTIERSYAWDASTDWEMVSSPTRTKVWNFQGEK